MTNLINITEISNIYRNDMYNNQQAAALLLFIFSVQIYLPCQSPADIHHRNL